MQSLFDSRVRTEIIARIKRLQPNGQRQWGTMTPHRMICHLIDGIRISFNEIEAKAPKGLWNSKFGRWFAIDSPMPWPKGKLKSPSEFFQTKPGDFEADRTRLIEYVNEHAKGADRVWGESVFLGKLTPAQWSRMQFRHIDYHLKQFGV